MVIRRLDEGEYGKLLSVADGYRPDPRSSIALVAENEEAIIGRVFLVSPAHVEGIWVAPRYRARGLADQLMAGAEEEAVGCGVERLFAYAINGAIERHLSRLGYQKQGLTVWATELIR